MKILIVNQHIHDISGGSEKQCHIIAQELANLGNDVTYAVCRPRLKNYKLPYDTVKLDTPFIISFIKALNKIKPDLIYWRYNKKKLLICVLVAKLKLVKFIFAVSHINDLKLVAAKPAYTKNLSLSRRIVKFLKLIREQLLSVINFNAIWLIDALILQHSGQVRNFYSKPYKIIYNSYTEVQSRPNVFEKIA